MHAIKHNNKIIAVYKDASKLKIEEGFELVETPSVPDDYVPNAYNIVDDEWIVVNQDAINAKEAQLQAKQNQEVLEEIVTQINESDSEMSRVNEDVYALLKSFMVHFNLHNPDAQFTEDLPQEAQDKINARQVLRDEIQRLKT